MALGHGALSEQPLGAQPTVTTGYVAPTGTNVTADLKGNYVPPTANAIQGSLGDATATAPASVSFAVAGAQGQQASATASTGVSLSVATMQGQKGAATAATVSEGAHRYWRLYIAATNGGNSGEANIAELQLRDTAGGANVATGGTPVASSQWSSTYSAAKAFDGSGGTFWSSTGSSAPHWLGYDFGVGQARTIVEIAITARNDSWAASLSPKTMSVQYSDDGATWTPAWSIADQASWGVSETKVLGAAPSSSAIAVTTLQGQKSAATLAAAAPAEGFPSSNRWRVYVTAAHSTAVTIGEVAMYATDGGPNLCTGGTASASSIYSASYPASSAFDGSSATAWGSVSGGMPGWVEYQFATAQAIRELRLTAHSTYQGEMVKDFQLQYWNGSAWVATISRTGEPVWTDSEARVFTQFPKKLWRLYSERGTSSAYITIAEIQFRATAGGADLTTGGLASASTIYNSSNPAAHAFDNSAATSWASAIGLTHWTQYTLPTASDVAEYVLQASSSLPQEMPTKVWLAYQDGAGAWVTVDTRENIAAWTASESRTYTLGAAAPSASVAVATLQGQQSAATATTAAADAPGYSTQWRINISAATNSLPRIYEFEFRETVDVAQPWAGGTITASGSAAGLPEYAGDNTINTNARWVPGSPLPQWWQYTYATSKKIVQYAVTCGNTFGSITAWTLEYFDGAQWVVADTRSGQTYSSHPGTNVYTVGEAAAASVSATTKQGQSASATLAQEVSVALATKQGQTAAATVALGNVVSAATRQGQRASAIAASAASMSVAFYQEQTVAGTILAQSTGEFAVSGAQAQASAGMLAQDTASTVASAQGQRAAATAGLSSSGAISVFQEQTVAAQLAASTPVSFSISAQQAQKISASAGAADAPQAGAEFSVAAFQGTPYLQLRNRNLAYDAGAFQGTPYAIAKPYNDAAVAPVETAFSVNTSQAQRASGATLKLSAVAAITTLQAQRSQIGITVTESLGPDSTVAASQAQAAAGSLQVSTTGTGATRQKQALAGTLTAVTPLQVASRQAQRTNATGTVSSAAAVAAAQVQASAAAGTLSVSLSVASRQAQRSDATASLSSSMTAAMAQAQRANAALLAGAAGLVSSAQQQGSTGALELSTSMLGQSGQAQAAQADAGTAAALSVAGRQAQRTDVTAVPSVAMGGHTDQRQGNKARSRLESGDGAIESAQSQDAHGTLGLAASMSVAVRQGQRNGAVVGIAVDMAVAAGQAQHIGNTTFLVLESVVGVATAQSQQSATGTLEQYVPVVGALEAYTTFRPALIGSTDTRLPLTATFRSRPALAGRAKARPTP